jgi:hypothetical protein
MNTKPNKSKLRAFTRSLIVLPALAVALSLAFAGAASAQTTVPFQASVNNISTNGGGNPGLPCQNPPLFQTQFYCGTANIAGQPAYWWFDSPNGLTGTPVGSDCWHYTGTSNFTLVNDTSSTLVLNEDVTLCHPGNSGNTPNFWNATDHHTYPYGHPNRLGDPTTGWTVCSTAAPVYQSPSGLPTGCGLPIDPTAPFDPTKNPLRYSTGVFSGLTGGSGTDDSFQINGAILTIAWSGSLTF